MNPHYKVGSMDNMQAATFQTGKLTKQIVYIYIHLYTYYNLPHNTRLYSIYTR